MLVLDRKDVQELVPMHQAVELMKVAFRELSAGRSVSPLRSVVPVHDRAVTLVMPAYVPAAKALGFKVVSIFEENPQRDLPTINAMVCLLDGETGVPAAIMNGSYLTALRTGAVSGAATDLLAREESAHLVVIGAGAQGVTQAAAVAAVRPIERITVVARSAVSEERFRQAMAQDWPDLTDRLAFTDDASVVREADIVCAATTSRTPVFDANDIRPGTHVNGVGAFKPDMQEIPAELLQNATIVVDQVEAAMEEAGDFLIPIEKGELDRSRIGRELGQIVVGDAPARSSNDELTFFKSVGNAVQDVTVARHAVDAAQAAGRGQTVSLD